MSQRGKRLLSGSGIKLETEDEVEKYGGLRYVPFDGVGDTVNLCLKLNKAGEPIDLCTKSVVNNSPFLALALIQQLAFDAGMPNRANERQHHRPSGGHKKLDVAEYTKTIWPLAQGCIASIARRLPDLFALLNPKFNDVEPEYPESGKPYKSTDALIPGAQEQLLTYLENAHLECNQI